MAAGVSASADNRTLTSKRGVETGADDRSTRREGNEECAGADGSAAISEIT